MIKSLIVSVIAFLFLINSAFTQVNQWIEEGKKAFNQKNYEKSLELLGKVLDHETNNPGAWYYHGLAYLYLGKYDEAISDFTKAIQLKPSMADSYNNRGLAKSLVGKLEAALNDFDKAIGLDPQFTEAYINRGSAYISLLNIPAAKKDFDKAIKLNPNNPEVYFQRARIYNKQKQYKKAIADYTKAITLGLAGAKVYYNRGNVYYKSGDYKKAIADYNKSLELDPKDSEALNNRAMAYDKAGMTKQAEAERKKLAEMAGLNITPFENIKFKTFSDKNSAYTLELPCDWNQLTSTKSDVSEMIVSLEKMQNQTDAMTVGVTIAFHRNMSKKYNIKTAEDALKFWEGSQSKNSQDYHIYEIISKKLFNKGGYTGFLNKVRLQVNQEFVAFRMYELVMAKDDNLFYAYFQAPETQFNYYEKIFDKAVASVVIKY